MLVLILWVGTVAEPQNQVKSQMAKGKRQK